MAGVRHQPVPEWRSALHIRDGRSGRRGRRQWVAAVECGGTSILRRESSLLAVEWRPEFLVQPGGVRAARAGNLRQCRQGYHSRTRFADLEYRVAQEFRPDGALPDAVARRSLQFHESPELEQSE